jgi:tRNA-Thr(GGU) m(6)t(6)A37 methyltransferase TsaA
MNEIRYKPIGTVHSPFKTPKDVPKESAGLEGVRGSVEVAGEYAEGLKDIEGFSHIFVIFHFHMSKGHPLIVKPYWGDGLRGVFATRSPSRPNPIGVSIVRLTKREGNVLHIQGLDMVDGTPVLDIKPYVSKFDQGETTRAGWLEKHLRNHYSK